MQSREPSVGFVYPGDDKVDLAGAIEAAESAALKKGFRTAISFFSAMPRDPRDLIIDHAALCHILTPGAEKIVAAAKRCGVSRKTLHKRINRLKKLIPFLAAKGDTHHE